MRASLIGLIFRGPGPRGAVTAILFDFDFTLADSSRGVYESARFAMAKMGLAEPSLPAVRGTIGLPLTEAFRLLSPESPASDGEEFNRLFIQRADEVMVDGTDLLPGVRGALEALSEFRLAIVSTKYRRRIEAILARESLDRHFSTVVGGEDVPRHKPDPAGLCRALSLLGLAADEAVYVGDHVVDAQAAAAASVRFVAVATGTTPRPEFASYRPLATIRQLDELPRVFDSVAS